jgi:sarcosine reductase
VRLEMGTFQVEDIVFSQRTSFADGVLSVSKDELHQLVLQDSHFSEVEIDLARPGDSTRIINILDVVEPRHKVSGPGTVFPGLLGPPLTVGRGRDHRLQGMALVMTGELAPGEAVHWRDGIIDMWGPGAQYTPFADTLNLVLHLKGKADFSPAEQADLEMVDVIDGSTYAQAYNRAARTAGFRVADYLASVTAGLEPQEVEVYELSPVDTSLPRVVYACQMHLNRWLYGEKIGWQPTLLHPNEMLDGAIFSSFMGPANSRDASYIYQNHPIVRELFRHHGVDLNFVGLLLWFYGRTAIVEKERTLGFGVKLLSMLGVNGVVMTWIGDGHSGIDIMMLCQKCEHAGIKTTILSPEMALTPDDPGFVHFVPEADAIVSTGNYEMQLTLSPAARVLGGTTLSVPQVDASASLPLSLRYLYASTSPLGFGKLAGVAY